MAQTWPATLPDIVTYDEYSESPPDNALRTSMDVGPPKSRRRTTANVRPLSVMMILTTAQVETLDVFYDDTLASGTLTFNFDHPRTETTEEMQFAEPPIYGEPDGDYFKVTMKWWVLP